MLETPGFGPLLRAYRRMVVKRRMLRDAPSSATARVAGHDLVFEGGTWPTANVLINHSQDGVLTYEPAETEVFVSLVSPGDVVFDIGAQVGYFSILAAKLGAKVVAFELVDMFADDIGRHVRANSVNVTVERFPVALDGQRVTFGESFGVRQTRASVSLDTYCARTGVYPDVLKIDVEGAELDVLRGAREVLTRKPSILLAVHPPMLAGRTEELLETLDRLGYETLLIPGLKPLSFVPTDYCGVVCHAT